MAGQNNVRKGDKALNHVIRDHSLRQILEEKVGLSFIDVDGYPVRAGQI